VGEPGAEREITAVIRSVTREALTVPWNQEMTENTEHKLALKIGYPTESGKNCREEPAPPGCIKLAIIYPAINLQLPFEGSIQAKWTSGSGSGLSPSSFAYEETSEKLHVTGQPETTMLVSGSDKVLGVENMALLSVK
jgi:hypothetical protein